MAIVRTSDRLMLLTVVQGTAQGVSAFAQIREKLEGTLL